MKQNLCPTNQIRFIFPSQLHNQSRDSPVHQRSYHKRLDVVGIRCGDQPGFCEDVDDRDHEAEGDRFHDDEECAAELRQSFNECLRRDDPFKRLKWRITKRARGFNLSVADRQKRATDRFGLEGRDRQRYDDNQDHHRQHVMRIVIQIQQIGEKADDAWQ